MKTVYEFMRLMYRKSPTDKAAMLSDLQALDENYYSYLMDVESPMQIQSSYYETVMNNYGDTTASLVKTSANYTNVLDVETVVCDTSNNNIAVTIDVSVMLQGDDITIIKNAAANTITVSVANSGTINGLASYSMTANGDVVTLCYIGNNTLIIK